MKKKLQMLTQKKKKITKNPRHPQKPLLLMTILTTLIIKLFGHDEASTPDLGED